MKYIITKAELKETVKGTILKVDLKDESGNFENGVTIWNSYPNFHALKVGVEMNGIVETKQNGQYTNKSFKEERTNTLNRAPSGIRAAQERKAEYVKEAQERKSDSIAYFNAINSAISLLPIFKDEYGYSEEGAKTHIKIWRDWFLKEWKDYNDKPPF